MKVTIENSVLTDNTKIGGKEDRRTTHPWWEDLIQTGPNKKGKRAFIAQIRLSNNRVFFVYIRREYSNHGKRYYRGRNLK